MEWIFFGQKKTHGDQQSCFGNSFLKTDCRFLSDKRPAHAFYVLKTPATIAALEEAL